MPLVPLLAGVALAASPMTAPVPSLTSTSAVASPSAMPARQVMSWRWTDGSKSTERIFSKANYHTPERIPRFEVRVYPAYPPWKARLLFWVNGAWIPRDAIRSDPDGRMQLSFDPIGPTGSWEDVTWIVRVRLKDISQSRSARSTRAAVKEIVLTVRYVAR